MTANKNRTSNKKTNKIPSWAVLVVVGAVVVGGIVLVYQSFAAGGAPPAGYQEITLHCKQGNCGRNPLPGFRSTSAYAKSANSAFDGACETGVAFRSKTQASRNKAPANSSAKDICVKTDRSLQFPGQ